MPFPRLILRWCLTGMLVYCLGFTAWAQAGAAPAPAFNRHESVRTNIRLDANPTLFTVLAAINVAGYRDGLHARGASPLRMQLRHQLLAKNLAIYGRLRMFYHEHLLSNPASNLAQYISLSMFLSSPPRLALTEPITNLPPDAAQLTGFLPLLRRFYNEAGLAQLWQQYAPYYRQAIRAYSPVTRQAIAQVDNYFRLQQNYLGRRLYIFPEFLASPLETHARDFLGNYFIVVSLNPAAEMHDIRHTYLHYVLDPLVREYPGAVARVLPLAALAQKAPALEKPFRETPALFYIECWVRAVEAHLDGGPLALQWQRIRKDQAHGLLLCGYFFRQLLRYDRGVANFAAFYPHAAYNVPVRTIEAQVKKGKILFAAAPPQAMPRPPAAPSLLKQGEDLILAGNLQGASQLARASLHAHQPNTAEAEYLLAEIAARQGRPHAAQRHFQGALAAATYSDTHVRTWANIYLARILDLEHHRAQAIDHYRAALATAATPSARQIALQGIAQAFQARPPAAVKPPTIPSH